MLSWRKTACSANCYQIFLALCAWTNGYESTEAACRALQKCDLSGLASFEDNIRTSIQNILHAEHTNHPEQNTDKRYVKYDK